MNLRRANWFISFYLSFFLSFLLSVTRRISVSLFVLLEGVRGESHTTRWNSVAHWTGNVVLGAPSASSDHFTPSQIDDGGSYVGSARRWRRDVITQQTETRTVGFWCQMNCLSLLQSDIDRVGLLFARVVEERYESKDRVVIRWTYRWRPMISKIETQTKYLFRYRSLLLEFTLLLNAG